MKKISDKRKKMLAKKTPDRNAWIAEQGEFCWICGYTPDTYGMGDIRPIDVHEMVRLSEHVEAWCRASYFLACRPCHGEHCHGAMLIEELLALKKLYDPEHYSLKILRPMRTKLINVKKIGLFYNQFLTQQQRGERR